MGVKIKIDRRWLSTFSAATPNNTSGHVSIIPPISSAGTPSARASDKMSWLWGNETTEQAQIVVSALQTELDERETKIQALEAALRREQQDFQQLLQGEIRELEAKKSRIQQELQDVDALIRDKQKLLQKGKGAKKKKAAQSNGNGATAAGAAPLEKKASEKKKKKPKSGDAAAVVAAPKKTLPVDEQLVKVAKVEPNVAFIIQRSTVRPYSSTCTSLSLSHCY